MKTLILLPFVLFFSCQTIPYPDYQSALKSVKVQDPSKIYNNLIPIRPENSTLKWQNVSKKKVLVVTLKFSEDLLKSPDELKKEVWVSTFPELKNFCSNLKFQSPKDLKFRLNQYLGLKPDDQKNFAISFWISPSDLFRPCPDKEITDTKCDLDFPANTDPAHKAWMENLRNSNSQYPWTQLGYTYDWGNLENPIGASEFIARKDAKIQIESSVKIEEYCK